MQIISVLFTCTFNNLEQQKHTLTRWPLTPNVMLPPLTNKQFLFVTTVRSEKWVLSPEAVLIVLFRAVWQTEGVVDRLPSFTLHVLNTVSGIIQPRNDPFCEATDRPQTSALEEGLF